MGAGRGHGEGRVAARAVAVHVEALDHLDVELPPQQLGLPALNLLGLLRHPPCTQPPRTRG
eukprot:7229488-Prymnesium_polylepis.1